MFKKLTATKTIFFSEGLKDSTMATVGTKKKKTGDGETIKVILRFKRYIHSKKMTQ